MAEPDSPSSAPEPAALTARRRPLCSMTILFSLLEGATVRQASAATPSLLLGRPGAGEYQPVEGDASSRGRRTVVSTPVTMTSTLAGWGGDKFKVNAGGTNGANGEIDGDRLVYQQFKRGASDRSSSIFRASAAIHPAA